MFRNHKARPVLPSSFPPPSFAKYEVSDSIVSRGYSQLTMAKIEVSIPRKQGAAAMGRDKAVAKFHDQVMRAIMQHVDFSVIKAVLVASPGFVKDGFLKYMHEQAQRQGLRVLLDNKHKFVGCHSSSGHRHSLKEVLSDAQVMARLDDTVPKFRPSNPTSPVPRPPLLD